MTGKIPIDVRKSCMMLGLDPNSVNRELVLDACKKQVQKVNPNGETDSELVRMFNIAKDTIIRWLDGNKI